MINTSLTMKIILRDLHWLPVRQLIDFKVKLITFKIINNSGSFFSYLCYGLGLMYIFQNSTLKLCLLWTSPRQWQRKTSERSSDFLKIFPVIGSSPRRVQRLRLLSMGKVLIQYP